jgi:hypothetical protein
MQPCDIETKINKNILQTIFPQYFHFEDGCFRSWAGGQVGRWAVSTLGPGQSVTSQHWRYLSPILVSFAINERGKTKRKRAQSEIF